MKKVFLGGTCNDSKWRDILISLLRIDFFNPVVKDWNEEAYKRELQERQDCDYVLYVITPQMSGVYSIAECTNDSVKIPTKTIFCILKEDDNKIFDAGQLKSLIATMKLIHNNGAKCFTNLIGVAKYLNMEK